jgi:uncharacterized protein (DUF2141 family)
MMLTSQRGAKGLFLAGGLACLWSCAHVESPPGGPPDKIPPYVGGVFPAPGQTRVPRDVILQLQFSEWVQSESVKRGIVLNPTLPGKLEIEADGNRIHIRHDTLLRQNTTYRLVVPAQIKDMAGITMDSAFSLSFSTGEVLDTGKITGRIFATDGTNLRSVWAALYSEERAWASPRRGQRRRLPWPDSSVNPWREKPSALAPCDSLGRFQLTGLAPGRYGLLAFADANQNQLPDNGEAMAIGPAGIRVSPEPTPPVVLRLAGQDTTALKLTQAVWTAAANASAAPGDTGWVAGALKLKFNRALAWPQASLLEAYAVRDSMTSAPLFPRSMALAPDGDCELWFARLPSHKRFALRVHGLVDEAGNGLDTNHASMTFETAPRQDSASPALTVWLPEKQRGRPQLLPKDPISYRFDLLVRSSLPLSDSALKAYLPRWNVRADSFPLGAIAQREGPFGVLLRWTVSMDSAKVLFVGLNAPVSQTTDSSHKPLALQPLGRAEIMTPSQRAALKITVSTRQQGWTAEMNNRTGPGRRSVRLPGLETRIDSLAAGTWGLLLYADPDGNGYWFPGRVHPWRSQESTVNWPDTLTLKSGSDTGPIRIDGL